MTDTLIVYGALCSWWDDISKTANTKPDRTGVPLCPHCGSVLFQQEPAVWWAGVERYEADGHPGYRVEVENRRGLCNRFKKP